ncbi:hypothetical protein BpHYR1_006420 [Brachionus plicatilis]|uniref:Uncharacterized protein n=1 Tax=Brachionus plicatilis TaxID=10195 RepID=A0A3M7PTA6_BRAPC|nr:hypothetical protein BpHYR1_006420 [Brachionus plicatilis]
MMRSIWTIRMSTSSLVVLCSGMANLSNTALDNVRYYNSFFSFKKNYIDKTNDSRIGCTNLDNIFRSEDKNINKMTFKSQINQKVCRQLCHKHQIILRNC